MIETMRDSSSFSLIEGKKYAPENLGRVLVIGLGVSGKAVTRYLVDLLGNRVQHLCVLAGPYNDDAFAWTRDIVASGAEVIFDCELPPATYDLCIASPGISQFSDFYLQAQEASAEIISEVEFAWRESDELSTWIGITGTNGKTTTTALTAFVLQQAGFNARPVGNIGDTCIDAVAACNTDVYVAELSSYQLASTKMFAPRVAVMTNITPDHLSWHKSHENYAQAKWKILANLSQVDDAWAILDATNDEVRARVRALKAQTDQERGFSYIPIGTKAGYTHDMRMACGSANAAFVNDDQHLVVACAGEEHVLCKASDLQIKGLHNVANALAAASAALALGAPERVVAQALCAFAPLKHRIEPAGSVGGVACYNDSKATNVDATLKALSAFDPIKPIVLLGGRDKGSDLSVLVDACETSVKAAVCFGEARQRFAEALAQPASHAYELYEACGMEDAFDTALEIACPGDVIVLSPACASFDEFSCFEERGDVFISLVAARAAAYNEKSESQPIEARCEGGC